MAAIATIRGPRAKSCRSRRRARKPAIPAAGRSFEIQINVVRICRIPLPRQMSQMSRAKRKPKEISMALQDRLDAFKADFVGGKLAFKPTKERLAAMERATAELVESGQAQRAKKAGDTAPLFTLNDPEGHPV